jgi:hypothetical protein
MPTDEAAAPLAELPPAFEVSGLLTNGLRPTEEAPLFLEEGISVAEKFTDADTRTSPSRAEHLARSSPG